MTPDEIKRINEAREVNVNAGLNPYSGAGATALSLSQGLGTITSESLGGSTTPFNIPSVAPATGAEGLSGFATSYAEQQKLANKSQADLQNQLTLAKTKAETDKSATRQALESTYQGITNLFSSQSQLEQDAGLDKKAQRVTDVTNQIEASERAKVNELRALDSANMTDAGRATASRDINRKYAFEQADLALIQSAANRDYETASNIINRKIELQLEPLKTKLEFQKFFYEENKDLFNKAEQREFESLTKATEREYEDAKTLEKYKADVQLEAVKNGVQIPSYVLGELNRATNQSEVAQILARNGVSLQKTDNQIVTLKNGTTVVVDTNTGKVISTVGGGTTPSTKVAGLTPEQQADPFIQLLLDSEGGKPITDTFAQSLNKGLNVLGQIGGLQENIKNTNTGPIAGAFRGANPWDTNAQTIKAQLNAVVPNLARGVYGEVGVLTDNDIANYSKTLPTLKSTEDIRNAVLGITVDLISKSIKRTLEVNAANQKDVSGFVDIYTEMVHTRDSIFAQIPGYKGAGSTVGQVDDVAAESAFDSVISPESSSWLVNTWNNLFK